MESLKQPGKQQNIEISSKLNEVISLIELKKHQSEISNHYSHD